MERFLRKGIVFRRREDWDEEEEDGEGGGEGYADDEDDDGDVEAELEGGEEGESKKEVDGEDDFDRELRMSPKYRSASFKASSCGTPAKATTILSGL